MKTSITRLLLLIGLTLFMIPSNAASITATWDFTKIAMNDVNIQGITSTLNSDQDGIVMTVDATNGGKLWSRGSDAQFNSPTILQVPVKSTSDEVYIQAHYGYHHYTVGGTAVTNDDYTYVASAADVAQGYVVIQATKESYILKVSVTQNEATGPTVNYTLTYYDTDAATVIGTQEVEANHAIGSFAYGAANVSVNPGYAFRGWCTSKALTTKATSADKVSGNMALYAKQTEKEVASATAEYFYDLTDATFDQNDHEALEMTGGVFHDDAHGFVFGDGTVKLLVGGNATLTFGLCQWAGAATFTAVNPNGEEIGSFPAKLDACGNHVFKYTGPAGFVTFTIAGGGSTYISGITIKNQGNTGFTEPNTAGVYEVKAGDVESFKNALIAANADESTGRKIIFLPDGTYDLGSATMTQVSGNNISIVGQSMDKTIIKNTTADENINNSATLYITGSDVYLQDLTIKNAYAFTPGSNGRAVTIMDSGNRTIQKNVRLLSYQDTYYTYNNKAERYIEDGEIQGAVDFICGDGNAYFNRTTISVASNGEYPAIITAHNGQKTGNNNYKGYVFESCIVDNNASSWSFGRAWNYEPQVTFLNTNLETSNDKLISTRWTTTGINDKAPYSFKEYNSIDAYGESISPASLTVSFLDKEGNPLGDQEVILSTPTDYSYDNVFVSGWKPKALATQKKAPAYTRDGNTLTIGTGTDNIFAVFNNGKYVGMTNSVFDLAGLGGEIQIRQANAMGGFGAQTSFDMSLILDENENYSPAAGNFDVTLKRTIHATSAAKTVWNTVVLPFALTSNEVKNAFGADAEIAVLNGYTDGVLHFTTATGTEANVPFMLKTSTEGTEYNFSNVTIVEEGSTVLSAVAGNATFQGSYQKSTLLPQGAYFYSDGAFYKNASSTQKMKGFRGYFDVAGANAKMLMIDLNGTTDINQVNVLDGNGTADIYSVSGKLVRSNATSTEGLEKGVYIVNGKKVILK